MASGKDTEKDQLAASLNDLFTNVSDMIKGELQVIGDINLALFEWLNLKEQILVRPCQI